MSWQLNGRSIIRCSHSFSRFQYVVEDYDKFDVGTKSAILEASSSVASLISRTGDKVVFIGSGTIIECEAHDESFSATILTSATFLQGPAGEASIPPNLEIDVYLSSGKLYEGQVLTYDFYYNIAIINVKSDALVSTAKIRCVDDSLALDSNTSVLADANLRLHGDEETGSTRYNLFPGELVIALARYSEAPHEIMASPGFFSCDDFPHDCKELFWTTCTVNKAAVGGPVINCYGEVIGVSFVLCPFNAFLPINIALKCLEDLKKNRQVPRPWLGVGVANLYTAKLEKLDELTRTFPRVVKGAIIEQVKNMRIRACVKRTKVRHWSFWSVRKWLKAKVLLENIALFYVAVVAGLLPRLLVSFTQHTPGQLRNRKSGNSGGATVSEQGETVTFADVAGVDEAKEELEDIVEFLRNPDRYVRLGARPPRGVLLVGLPGTGKTLLAKAVSGEADVPFISCSASEFVELYVGMGASRVRDLFARAKKEAPSIIFIDEIDAVAKSRDGKFRVASNDEREQTLNQLLTEMDGFDSNSAVIVLGATNRADVLDHALRRPGRFDRVVSVETPDRTGREAILEVHVSKKELPLGQDVDLSDIASMTTGFTGADLANLVNEAALLAGRDNKFVVEKTDFIQAVERSIAGIEKKTARLQGSEKAVVARHEAGHAVVGTAVANLLSGQPQVEKLSILPRSGGALGFTYTPPSSEDRYLLFVDELRGRLVTLLGGRAAEEFIFSGRVSTGALDDIRRATDMAYKAVAEYGLNETIGPVSLATLSGGGMNESGGSSLWGRDQGHLVDLVQREVKDLLQSALDVALSVVRANPTVLEGLGAHLEEKERVEGEELKEWLKFVVAPAELTFFIRGKQGSLLPLQSGS